MDEQAKAEFKEWFEEKVAAVVIYAQTTERLLAAMGTLTDIGNRLSEIAEKDTELTPEIHTAVGHLLDATRALERAYKFGAARMDVKLNG